MSSTITVDHPAQDLILRLGDNQAKRKKLLNAFREKKLPLLLKKLGTVDEDTIKLMNEIISDKNDKDNEKLVSILNARNDSIEEMNKLKDVVGEEVVKIFQSILVDTGRLAMENMMLCSGMIDAQCTIEEKDREISHLTQSLNKLKSIVSGFDIDLSVIDEWDNEYEER